jgi:hypothetical protein
MHHPQRGAFPDIRTERDGLPHETFHVHVLGSTFLGSCNFKVMLLPITKRSKVSKNGSQLWGGQPVILAVMQAHALPRLLWLLGQCGEQNFTC